MELFTPEFVSALLAIIAIDLVLAGDNAIVIALVARRLPQHQQRLTIIAGTAGAVVVRVLMTLAIVWLLNIPYVQLAGGLLLVWIAWKLLAPDRDEQSHAGLAASQASLGTAIRTIVVADAVMGLDNVLGVAGAAHGNFLLVVIGLLVSVPIMVFGSTLILKMVDRFPIIIYLGAGILAWTAVKMIVSEPMLAEFFGERPLLSTGLYILVVGAVLASGLMRSRRSRRLGEEDYPAVVATSADGASQAAAGNEFDVAPAAAMPAFRPADAARAPAYAGSFSSTPLDKEFDMLRILVPVDGSQASEDAVAHVRKLARRSQEPIKVILANVQPLLSRHITRFVPRASLDAFRRERSMKALATARAALEQAGIDHDLVLCKGEPAQAIADCASERGVQKIVIGTTRKSALARMVGDSITNRVIELAEVPVEVVAREQPGALERFGIPAGVGAGLALLLLVED
ncbi:MAG: Integral rane protein TerC [Paucimonas sp.]|nr:Integral rane protein TerC [Paucimonas sp.]